MNVRLLQVLFLCLLIALCGCGKGKNSDKAESPANAPAATNSNQAADDPQNNTLANEGPYHEVSFDVFEASVEMLKSRKSVSELFKNYESWKSDGADRGGLLFTDMESDLTYGFDASYFEDLAQPKLKGNEVISSISGTFDYFYPGVYLHGKEETQLYLTVLFGTDFTEDTNEYSEDYGSFSAYLENYGVSITVGTDQGQIKPDSIFYISYESE